MFKTLTTFLIEENIITETQLQEARQRQLGAKIPIQDVLVEMGFIEEEKMMEALSSFFKMPIINLNAEEIDEKSVKIISYDLAKRYGVFPIRTENNNLILAMSNPQDIVALDDLRLFINSPIQPLLASKTDIATHIEKHYKVDDSLYDLLKNIVDDSTLEVIKDDSSKDGKISDASRFDLERSPVVRLVKVILSDAIRNRATDIHVEPQENFVEVRYRVDGYLKNILKIPSEMYPQFVARIKILSNLDIAETRKPQDGRADIMYNNRKIDLRISIIPAYYGEKIVFRVLDPQKAKISLEKLGFDPQELELMKDVFTRPQGMVLVTGPTGSGKTSTLYAALGHIKSETKNIVTVEDPIEYLMEGINQIQINPKKDVTFAAGLRSILRQDPDVILVGEIRDAETAEVSFKAALTGHLVFSTLHTNDAVSSISRLIDIGLEPYLIASSVALIVAQRLVRVICSQCKEEYTPDKKLQEKFSHLIKKYNITKFYHGKGCAECGFSGYLGRNAILELFEFTKKIKALVSENATQSEIALEAQNSGLKSLAESGIEKVALGITTLEEVAHITVVDETAVKVKPEESPQDKIIDKPAKEQEVPAAESSPDSVTQTPVREKPLVLITDDERNIRKLVSMRLRSAGFDIIEAENGQEAFEACMRVQPDLLIMDVMMPVMDGFAATRRIRSELKTAGIPIILLTAKKDTNSELEGLDAGADDYIAKPFDGVRLLARVKLLLKHK